MTYAKFVLALIGTAATAVVAALSGDGVIDVQEWVNIAILLFGALSVGYVPNALNAPVAKAVVSVSSAALTVAATVLNGVDSTGVLQMVVAGLTAAGVYGIRNEPVEA